MYGCNAHIFEDGEGLWHLVRQYQPQHILELGSGLGYTACLMAQASPNARVDTLEGDAEHALLKSFVVLVLKRIDMLFLVPRSVCLFGQPFFLDFPLWL